MDEKQNTAEAELAVEREMQRKQDKRDREKKELHDQKEMERQNIRAKYQLPKDSNTKKATGPQEVSNDKSCSIC